MRIAKAWIFLSAHDAGLGKHGNYADSIGTTYAWDTTVPNHLGPKPGDIVLLRDKEGSLGFSLVTSIVKKAGYKVRCRCESCGATKLRWSTKEAKLYCTECKHRNDPPSLEYLSKLGTFQADISYFFASFETLDMPQIRKIAKKEKSIHSIQEADFSRLIGALPDAAKRKLGLRNLAGNFIFKDQIAGIRLAGSSMEGSEVCEITGISSLKNLVNIDICLFDVVSGDTKFERRVKVLDVLAHALLRGDAEVIVNSGIFIVQIPGPAGDIRYEYPIKPKSEDVQIWLDNY